VKDVVLALLVVGWATALAGQAWLINGPVGQRGRAKRRQRSTGTTHLPAWDTGGLGAPADPAAAPVRWAERRPLSSALGVAFGAAAGAGLVMLGFSALGWSVHPGATLGLVAIVVMAGVSLTAWRADNRHPSTARILATYAIVGACVLFPLVQLVDAQASGHSQGVGASGPRTDVASPAYQAGYRRIRDTSKAGNNLQSCVDGWLLVPKPVEPAWGTSTDYFAGCRAAIAAAQ
jgi:hypothetical protein